MSIPFLRIISVFTSRRNVGKLRCKKKRRTFLPRTNTNILTGDGEQDFTV
jgi:hypothetical protein